MPTVLVGCVRGIQMLKQNKLCILRVLGVYPGCTNDTHVAHRSQGLFPFPMASLASILQMVSSIHLGSCSDRSVHD